MKVVVDMNKCQDHGQCVFAAPDVFQLDENGRLGYVSDPDDALRYVAEVLGMTPRRRAARGRPLGFVVRRRLRAMLPAAGRERLLLRGKAFSAFFDFDDPPFFKSFLEVEVRRGSEVVITCWGVSGFEADAERPILVDRVRIPIDSGRSQP